MAAETTGPLECEDDTVSADFDANESTSMQSAFLVNEHTTCPPVSRSACSVQERLKEINERLRADRTPAGPSKGCRVSFKESLVEYRESPIYSSSDDSFSDTPTYFEDDAEELTEYEDLTLDVEGAYRREFQSLSELSTEESDRSGLSKQEQHRAGEEERGEGVASPAAVVVEFRKDRGGALPRSVAATDHARKVALPGAAGRDRLKAAAGIWRRPVDRSSVLNSAPGTWVGKQTKGKLKNPAAKAKDVGRLPSSARSSAKKKTSLHGRRPHEMDKWLLARAERGCSRQTRKLLEALGEAESQRRAESDKAFRSWLACKRLKEQQKAHGAVRFAGSVETI